MTSYLYSTTYSQGDSSLRKIFWKQLARRAATTLRICSGRRKPRGRVCILCSLFCRSCALQLFECDLHRLNDTTKSHFASVAINKLMISGHSFALIEPITEIRIRQ